MTDAAGTPPGAHWWQALPPAEAQIACGPERHVVRWADGALTLPAHPDAEAELVLGALGGAKPACAGLAELWGRHHDDLEALVLGPRSATDQLAITREDIESIRLGAGPAGPVFGRMSRGQPFRVRAASGMAGPRSFAAARALRVTPEAERAWSSRMELLTLFGLGHPFCMRLAGTVAAAWAGPGRAGDRAAHRPALAAALAGRFALAAETWLGIDPDQVTVSRYEGAGWGRLELTGDTLRASLPLAWLARVWAADLAVVEGNLVVAVTAAGWPAAHVLAVPEPGAEPVTLRLLAGQDAGPGAATCWRVTG